jgi:hypothetical protein
MIRFFPILLLLAGCATQPLRNSAGIKTPPPMPSAKLAGVVETGRTFLPETRMIRIGWGDCGNQAAGIWYEVFTSTNLVKWEFYTYTFNHWIDIPCTQPGLNMFIVRASNGVDHSPFGGYLCAE